MSVAYLTTADLLALAADIRAKLATPDRDLKPDNLPAAPCPYDRVPYDRVPGYVEGRGCPVCKGIGMTHLTVAPDPDVTTSAPRPTVADQPPRSSHAIATDAELNEASNCGWAEATIDGGDQEARSLRAVADLIASRLAPPTLPADLRGLLDALVAADEAWNHSPSPPCASMDDLREMERRYRHDCRSRAVDWRAEALRHRADRATLAALAAEWRQGYIEGDDRTAADCAYRIEDLLSGGGS